MFILLLLIGFFTDLPLIADGAVSYHPGNDAVLWYGADRNETILPWFEDNLHHDEAMDPTSIANLFDEWADAPWNRRQTDEERLTGELFRDYASSIRPVYNATQPVTVHFGLNLVEIFGMDELKQVLQASFWLEMSWQEERLQWNPKEFSGLRMIRLPIQLLWTPDIVLYNNADDTNNRPDEGNDDRAMISHVGKVFLGPKVKLRSSCILDLTLYPYDEQTCTLFFASWTYDSSQLVLESKADRVELSQFVDSAKWQLLESSVIQTESRLSCCKAPFSAILVSITIRRRFLFNNMFDIFLPTIWLTSLCLMSFYLAPESGEKISLGITVLLTFSMFGLMITECTPRTSDFIPLISIYLNISMSLCSMVVGLEVFMLNIYGLAQFLGPVPFWVRALVIENMAPFLRIETRSLLQKNGYSKLKNGDRLRYTSMASIFSANNDCFDEEQFDNVMNELISSSRVRFLARDESHLKSDAGQQRYRPLINKHDIARRIKRRPPVIGSSVTEQDLQVTTEQSLAYVKHHYQSEAFKLELVSEWRVVATVFDRVAFWAFFIFTALSTFGLIVLIPLFQKDYPIPEGANHSHVFDFDGCLDHDSMH